MNLFDAVEWVKIAEEDIYSAKILIVQVRKPLEIICYHCAQTAEKLLKGFITYHDIEPQKTHDLIALLKMCKNIDDSFDEISKECNFINKAGTDIRYPKRIEINESDTNYCIKAVEKIMDFTPIKNLINEVEKFISNQDI